MTNDFGLGPSRIITSTPLPHFDERPEGVKIDTIVVHSMHADEEDSPHSLECCLKQLDRYRVSPHYIIDHAGQIYRCVEDKRRAWHAGSSRMPFPDDSRENVNHFSIGIELIELPDKSFEAPQYTSLAELCARLCVNHPITAIVGHDAIAPGRKTDPGRNFDCKHFEALLSGAISACPRMAFANMHTS